MTSEERFACALQSCRGAQLRLTRPREKVLRLLSEHRRPVSIEMVMRSDKFAGTCSETTVYRTLMLFREIDLVRQINLPTKTSYFILNLPGEPCDFLVCRHCGCVQELQPLTAVLRLEEEIAAQSGFKSLYHELELYGICPACQAARRYTAPATKLAGLKRPCEPADKRNFTKMGSQTG
jgi:Fur family ferric uptake transcriptional regulator